MIIYLSGPMSGYDDFNFPAFNEAASRWRASGFEVINPAENFGGDTGLPREVYLRHDVMNVAGAHGIAVLPDYELSAGSRLEVTIAQHLDMPMFDALTMRRVVDPPVYGCAPS